MQRQYREFREKLASGTLLLFRLGDFYEVFGEDAEIARPTFVIDLENIAVAHPAIAEAAVIGVKHPKWDERPLLVVQKKPGAELTREQVLPLGAVACDGQNPRRHDRETVLYYLEGASAADLYIASWAYDWARSQGLGMRFDLRS